MYQTALVIIGPSKAKGGGKKVYYTTALFSVGHLNFTHCEIYVTMSLPLVKQLRGND